MKRSVKQLLTFSLVFLLSFFASIQPAYAQEPAAWSGVCIDNSSSYGGSAGALSSGVATIQGFQCLIGNILVIVISIIGLAGFVMMIIGAFRYMLSGGNAKGVDDGQKTMTYAVVGLVIALSAYVIIKLISDFTGVQTILEFKFNLPSYTRPN